MSCSSRYRYFSFRTCLILAATLFLQVSGFDEIKSRLLLKESRKCSWRPSQSFLNTMTSFLGTNPQQSSALHISCIHALIDYYPFLSEPVQVNLLEWMKHQLSNQFVLKNLIIEQGILKRILRQVLPLLKSSSVLDLVLELVKSGYLYSIEGGDAKALIRCLKQIETQNNTFALPPYYDDILDVLLQLATQRTHDSAVFSFSGADSLISFHHLSLPKKSGYSIMMWFSIETFDKSHEKSCKCIV